MGEAKRKRLQPCIRGSGKPGQQCCWTPRGYHKEPAGVALRNTGLIGSHAGCYMRATDACDRTLSAEHLVSEGVLNVLAEGEVTITAARWLNGETKTLCHSWNLAHVDISYPC
jgi:hypothetical protein